MEPVPPIDPLDLLATLAVLSVVVGKIVEAARRKWPYLDGMAVTALAAAVGVVVAYGLDLRGTVVLLETIGAAGNRTPPVWLDYVITGAAIGLGSGWLADFARRSGPFAPQRIETEVQVAGAPATSVETVITDLDPNDPRHPH